MYTLVGVCLCECGGQRLTSSLVFVSLPISQSVNLSVCLLVSPIPQSSLDLELTNLARLTRQ